MRTIYVVKTEELAGKGLTEIFETMESRGFFAERAEMELRPDFQQIIPSFVIRDKVRQCILLYQRKPKHTEERLAGLWTPIFGGHIDPTDWDKAATHDWVEAANVKIPPVVYNGLVREMDEETGIQLSDQDLEFFGLIEDKSNPVGKVHTGVLFLLDMDITEELKQQILSKSEIHDIVQVDSKDFVDLLEGDGYELESWANLVITEFSKCESC